MSAATTPSVESLTDFRCALLLQKWQHAEREKGHLLHDLGQWPRADLGWKFTEEEWSAVEVLDHLVLTEEAVLRQSQNTLAGKSGCPTWSERLRFALFDRAFRLPIRVRVPAAVAFLKPPPAGNYEEIFNRWEMQRARWVDFLRLQDCSQARRAAIRHPAVGAISLADTVAFIFSHLLHHRHQLRRIRNGLILR